MRTRRAFLGGTLAATAVAVPSLGSFAASARPEQSIGQLADGRMVVTLDGVTIEVDSTDLPQLFVVHREDEGFGAPVVRLNRPRAGTRYLCIDWHGRMLVSELRDYELHPAWDGGRRRLAMRKISERVSEQVTVIGAVVGEVAS